MKRKILIILLVLIMFSGGYALAESVNGSWNGLPIVKLFSQGKALESSDSPAVILNDHVYVPLKALNPLGAQLTWNGNDYSVDVNLPKSKDVADIYNTFGNNIIKSASISIDENGKEILNIISSLDFSKQETNATYGNLLGSVKDFNVSEVDIQYNGGKIGFNISDLRTFELGKINGDELNKRAVVATSNITEKTKLTASDIAKLVNSVGIIYTYNQYNQPIAQGSCFLVSSYGLVVTNHHVLDKANSESVKINGQTYQTHFYTFDNPTTDLYGLGINIDANGKYKGDIVFPYLKLNTILPQVGDKVYAIGSPKELENTISEGIVSGIRKVNGITMIQHTANTDHGSSGGVLLNEYGEVIGVTSSGFDGTSLDFAIAASYVQDELDKLK